MIAGLCTHLAASFGVSNIDEVCTVKVCVFGYFATGKHNAFARVMQGKSVASRSNDLQLEHQHNSDLCAAYSSAGVLTGRGADRRHDDVTVRNEPEGRLQNCSHLFAKPLCVLK